MYFVELYKILLYNKKHVTESKQILKILVDVSNREWNNTA